MKKIAYLDCPSGIAGDMCLGALVDVGVPLEYLQEQLKQLSIEREYHLWAEIVKQHGQKGTKVHVDLTFDESHHHRHLEDIEYIIQHASLPPKVTQWSLKIFHQLAVAEGEVHGIPPEKVHFHEVGATDAIVDIVGTCIGLDWLGVDEVYCSAMPTGGGTVKAAHGRLSVPVPAVLKLWQSRQVPIYSNGIEAELVTPTGAAIATALSVQFGPPPAMNLLKVGLGAGTKVFSIPNLLRLWILGSTSHHSTHKEKITVLETQIDDLNPQAIGYLYDVLFDAGALDVFTQAISMKKSRPGFLLTVICPPEKITLCEAIIFRETTTLGIRRLTQERSFLARDIHFVNTEYGRIRVKVAQKDQEILNIQPEYEDCAAIARKYNLPWRIVHQMALQAWDQSFSNNTV
ncbi:nickel pincer cofactor biosynthesis protein LarC [Aphanothece hegewaldii CCALA 016]|uniref:Putative nickel insertion protein n=1 Tax=Aphanothece hegewaldii CCALA 016 TaxID=2107694 RepID=A0A2T1LX83_9CHRO|nr:nickel pincer cofactor biosynthesis protein LarC [Aphanothece hegewaldii]PSF36786.1 nickel pincer cofactor biosynthesis protein LarC [Aphanothece hegewaldii CCALA 016]